ncbi:MAG: hypothetical protein NC390_05310 [Fusobacterium sp.]|nr:hypothetical protein [Fusobacterium sp.]
MPLAERQRHKEQFSSINNFNKINTEGPSKINSQDLSFGVSLLSVKVDKIKPVKAEEIFDFYKNSPLGDMPKKLYDSLSKSESAKKYMQVGQDGNITFHKKSILRLIWDGATYPFVQLPQDMLNGAVELLGKFKPLEKWSKEVLDTPLFKGIRRRSKEDAKVNSFRGLAELKQKLQTEGKTEEEIRKILFERSTKMFDPKTGNYDTKHERALNRLVTGLPPAIFLANDAYNLSRMMDDNKEQAEKERKQRFKQETSRILTSGYLTLITLGALQKYINNSQLGIMLMTGSTVLVTEMFSRLSNGKHITRLTPEQAKAINAKNAKKDGVEPQAEPKKVSFKSNEVKTEKDKQQQKPLLSFDTVVKASLGIIGAGLMLKELRRVPKIDKFFNDISKNYDDIYKNLTVNKDYTISKDKFDKIVNVLNENGFKELAAQYEKAGKKALGKEDNLIHLGEKDKKIKPFVNFVIAPFKFAKNIITLPYRLTQKMIGAMMPKQAKAEKLPEDIKSLAMSIDKIAQKALDKKLPPQKFKDFVSDNILKGFNSDSMSNVSNAELSNLAKTAAAAATIWFLMTDNYNMVMLKSNGEDKEGADTKFKERFVQEGSRLFYQTLLIDLFNSTFRNQYNASLFGMSWISLTNTTMGEWLTRKSVGVAVKPHTRDELLAMEKEKNEATGFTKKYYNFMTRLTGKRSIESYNVKKDVAKPQEKEEVTAQALKTADYMEMIRKAR